MNITEITEWLNSFNIENFTIDKDLSVDVDGEVVISNKRLTKIPVKFNKVSGNFYCTNNYLTSLEHCPSYVSGNFYCTNNYLTSLEHCPSHVGGHFSCSYNKLTSLENCPSNVSGNFYCNSNCLSLEHCPSHVGGTFDPGDRKFKCSFIFAKFWISKSKTAINQIDNPSENMLILHNMLWKI